MIASEGLNDYARRLGTALDKGQAYEETNRDIAHAFVVTVLALSHAKKSFLLLSNKLDTDLYRQPPIIDEMKSFLEKGGNLRILVEEEIEVDHPIWEVIEHAKASIRQIPSEKVAGYRYNFFVVDDLGFRFEMDRDQPKAYVAFCGTSDSEKKSEKHTERKAILGRLREIFEKLEEEALAIPA